MRRILLTFVSMMIVLSTLVHAEEPTQESVTKLYVATFNRAPDAAGLNYWLNDSGLQLEQIAQSFFDQPETQEAYPPGSTNTEFVGAVYANLFNREPELAGLTYWVAELDSGSIEKSVFILAVINGAQDTVLGNDATILANKTIVGLAFADAGLDDVEDATEIMSGITDDYATVTAALETLLPSSTLTQDLKDSITYMYNEEGLAYDLYTHIYKFQVDNNLETVIQLQNIATKSETKHIEAVNELAIKYDLNMTQYPDTDVPYSVEGVGDGIYSVEHIQDLYNTLYAKGIQSKQDALEVGCMVEVVDIDDLDEYIEEAEESNAPDVLEVFNFLITGSYKHYWTFNDALVGMGIAEGCCQMAKDLGHETCPTYPRN